MSDDKLIDFSPAKLAKIGPHDLAKLAKVSRVTASMWLNGHCQPHHLLTDRVNKLLALIQACLHSGSLPVPHDVVRRERGLYISNALIEAANARKKA